MRDDAWVAGEPGFADELVGMGIISRIGLDSLPRCRRGRQRGESGGRSARSVALLAFERILAGAGYRHSANDLARDPLAIAAAGGSIKWSCHHTILAWSAARYDGIVDLCFPNLATGHAELDAGRKRCHGSISDERLRMFELAVAADRWDTERDLQKVQLLVARTIESPDSMSFTADASRVMVELNRVNPPNVVGFLGPKLAAELSSQLAAGAAQRGLPNQDFLVAARGFYSLAVERYPSSVELLVQHAAASALLDDWRSVENSLEKAGQISDQTPHLDKKLAAQMILLPLKPAGYEAQTDYVPAEPLTNWLRTEVKAKLR